VSARGFAGHYTPLAHDLGVPVLERESGPLVRLSRSAGLPELLPDPCGLAFRFPDAYGPGAHQDPARALAPAPGPQLAELRERQAGELEFEVLLAGIKGGWRAVGRLALGERLAPEQTERLWLDPTNTGGGLELAGLLNRLRGPAYRASQEGRAATYRRQG
jgi:hypothetical protein